MKVALIQPNSPFLTNEKVFPNIGLVRVGTQLKKDGHAVKIHDLTGKDKNQIKFIMKNIANVYDYYGFSSTSPQFPYVVNAFKELKKANPSAKTILGGAHASALYPLKQKGIEDININDLEMFDTIFAGEGENTENLFKEGWQQGKLEKKIDNFEIPNRDLIDLKSYNFNLYGQPTTPMQTQRGCPHKCTFCSGRDIEMYNRVRTHSPERVIKELDDIHNRYGYKSFMIYDDEVNVNMGRLEELCDRLSERNYQFRAFVRSDSIAKHPESVDWMKKAGFVKLCTGVESGSDRMLKNINKHTTSEINSEARRIIGDRGIHYESFMILGHPDETYADITMTYKWLKDNKPDDFDINLATPYPGSKMYNDAIRSDKFEGYDWEFNGAYFNKPRYSQDDSFYKGLNSQSESNVRTNQIPNKVLKLFRNKIDKDLKK